MFHLTRGRATAEINTMGAYVNMLRDDKKAIFYPLSEIPDAHGEIKMRGGSHVCLPNFGAPGEFRELNQHGFGRLMEWSVVDLNQDRISLRLKGEGVYQHLYSLIVYELEEKSFTSKLEMLNRGRDELEVAPGFHPYFAIDQTEQGIVVDEEWHELASLAGTVFKERVRKVDFKNHTIHFETYNINRFAIWTDQLGEYVCVEPTYAANSFSAHPEQNMKLKSGESVSFSYTVHWE